MKLRQSILIAAALLVYSSIAGAEADIDQMPAANSKKVEQVLSFLEKQGISHIIEVRFDDWIWKAITLEENTRTAYYIDPRKLVIFKKKQEYDIGISPPENGKQIGEVVELIQQSGYPNIREVTFNNYVWKIKTYEDNREEKKFIVDQRSGEIIYRNADQKRTKPYMFYGLVAN